MDREQKCCSVAWLTLDKTALQIEPEIVGLRNQCWQEYYLKIGDYKNAYHSLLQNMHLNDSIRNEKVMSRIAEIDTRYRQDTAVMKREILLTQQNSQISVLKMTNCFWILLVVVIVIGAVAIYYSLQRKRVMQQLKFQDQAAQLRLQNIRNRISPHLMFNVLNQKISDEKDRDNQQLFDLVKLLRKSLEFTDQTLISLQDELEFVKTYIDLEQVKLGDEFKWHLELDDSIDTNAIKLPAMMIQIPVENALKHAIGSHNYASVENLFTPEGVSIYKKLLQYGNARIIHTPILKYFQYNEYVICRFIPMSFNFKTNNRTFIEDVVFYLNKDNKVCNIAFGLEKKALHNIASKDAWSEADREMIISFLENYKTAYALKRFDYINDIFSDNALIITGIVTKVNRTAESPYLSNTIVKYNRQTKAEYMRKLKYSFDSNEFINIRFADNTVRRSFKGNNLYGIQIKQDYFSTHYGDSGYLFLLVDLSDKSKPQIHD